MIARRFTPKELQRLQAGQRVLWLKNGGTNYEVVYFERVSERTGWCWVKRSSDALSLKPLKLSSLGTDQPREAV